jgi:hypothetical protein
VVLQAKKEPTSGLENRLPLLQLRVIIHVLQGVAQGCKCRIYIQSVYVSQPYSVLHRVAFPMVSEWCQEYALAREDLWTSSAVNMTQTYGPTNLEFWTRAWILAASPLSGCGKIPLAALSVFTQARRNQTLYT